MMNYAPLYATVLFAQVALGMLTPLTPILLIAHGVPTFAIGIVASAYYGGMLVGSMVVPSVLLRIGHIRALVIFCVVAADATLLINGVAAVVPWIAIRFVIGVCSIGMFTVVESWLNASARRAVRGRVFGFYMFASWTGSVLGASSLSLFRSAESLLTLAVAAFLTALLPTTILTRVAPSLPTRARLSLRDLFALSPAGVVTCFAAGMSSGMFFSMFPVVMERAGIDQKGISLGVSLCLLAGMAMQFPVGLLADRIRRVVIVRMALLVAMAACVGLFMSHALVWFAVFGSAYGATAGVLYGLGVGMTADRAAQEQLLGVSAGVLFAWAAGASCGPLLAAGGMAALGYAGVFAMLLVLFGVVLGIVLRRERPGIVTVEALPR
ncbi:MFS transporter [Acidiphilium sp.]|uniref:MFS transporter n=1 Tax=Acidiphilium sp. TaxID=527 RepID=UPI003D03EBC3